LIADFSGVDNAAHLSELESAACALRDSMPLSLKNKIKVFDFGFYALSENLKGGNPPIFQQAIDRAKEESEFYIIFGKESNSDGIYTKFWFDMKLPRTMRFSCHTERYWSDLIIKYKILANSIHEKNKKDFSKYHDAEIEVMDSIAHYIGRLKDCCIEDGSCNPDECVLSQAEAISIWKIKDL
jgi:hypothetical protein